MNKQTFLIVEDNKKHSALIDAMLNNFNCGGHRIISIIEENGKTAEFSLLEMFSLHKKVDFLIVDQMLANGTLGTDLIKFARSTVDLSNTTVILMTALDLETKEGKDAVLNARLLGCHFLKKPYKFKEFKDLVENNIGIREHNMPSKRIFTDKQFDL